MEGLEQEEMAGAGSLAGERRLAHTKCLECRVRL